jgi:hypothetical protein
VNGGRAIAARALVLVALGSTSACESQLDAPARRVGGALECAPLCAAGSECDEGSRCIAGRCVRPADRDRCTSDLECGVVRTFCGSAADCAEGEVCVDAGGGEGRCALVPDPGVACATFGAEEVALAPIGGSAEPMRVCVDGGARCAGGSCVEPCTSDLECTRPGAPRCDVVAGECGCAADVDCVAPDASRCVAGACVAAEAAEGACGGGV